jgi:signal peptidase I
MTVPLVVVLIIAALASLYLLFPVTAIKIVGDSMLPGLAHGQDVAVIPGYYESRPVERGDLVAIRLDETGAPLVRRVIALEGDLLGFPGGRVSVNGGIIQESYLLDPGRTLAGEELTRLSPQLEKYGGVPSRTVFVLNDNRDVPGDSRDLGFISTSHILGKVLA